MDAVHNPDNHAWIGEKIQLAEHFKEFHNVVYKSRAALSKKGGDLKTLSNKNVKRLVETIQMKRKMSWKNLMESQRTKKGWMTNCMRKLNLCVI